MRGAKITTLASGVLAAGAAFAHHGFGNFDTQKEVSLSGTITRVDFVNPHAYVYFDVVGENGAKVPHRCEMRAATVLRRSGWSADMFKVGEPIAITGAPDRFDVNSCYVNTVVFADGTSADRYAQLTKPGAAGATAASAAPRPARLPSGEPNLNGDWAPEQVVMTDPKGKAGALVPVSQVGNFKPGERPTPPAGGPPPGAGRPRVEYTEAGQKAAAAFRNFNQEDNPRMRCETTSILFDWTFDGPVNRITQNEEEITLQYGQLGFTRTIHMQPMHPANIAPSRAGHSIGKWENDVLVVDTIGFAPGVLNPPIMNSDRLHTVERFTFDPAAMKITRSYTATDPVYYTNEYTGQDTIGVADLPYAPDACREHAFEDFSNDGTAPPPAAGAAGAPAGRGAAPAGAPPAAPPEAPKPAKPWWKFWE
ncbi:MAG TPA: DUF6152 family protein [Gammaproteobacteria bacterium]|nr:DUF6152 family protein [Gammaproteobacteria bacterium]